MRRRESSGCPIEEAGSAGVLTLLIYAIALIAKRVTI
jgi:hypothetical protein